MALGDSMTWLEQARMHAEGKRGTDMFPSPRMARLAPQISSAFGNTWKRHSVMDTLRTLPIVADEA